MPIWLRRGWSFLGSITLAVAVLAAIGLVGVAGTLLPQGRPAAYYLERLGERPGELLLALGLDRAYSSPLLGFLAILLALSTLACSSRRARVIWRGRRRHGAGFLALHLGVVAVLAGLAITALAAREDYLWVTPGETARGLGLELTVTDFEVQYYLDHSPRQYITRGLVSGGRAFEVMVNRPSREAGVTIYQAGQSWRVHLEVLGTDGRVHSLCLEQGESRDWPGTRLGLVLADFDPGHPLDTPAALVLVHRGGEPLGAWWFRVGEVGQLGGMWLKMTGWHPRTGLLLRRDPGVPVAAGGAALVVTGLGLVFITAGGGRRT